MSRNHPSGSPNAADCLEKAVGASSLIAFSIELDSRQVSYLSPAFREAVGVGELPENLDRFLEFFHEDDRAAVLAGSQCDVRLQSPAGRRWYALRVAVEEKQGCGKSLSGVLFDVHERRVQEEKSKISEETLRYVFDAAPFPVTVTTPQGEVLYVNRRVYDFYGLTHGVDIAEQLRTTDFYVDPEARRSIVEKLLRDGEARDVIIHMKRKDGATYWASFSARIIQFAGKTAIISAQFDIDERKRSEDRLRESEEKFSKVFLNAPLIMGIADAETGRIVEVNRQFERVLGFTAEEVRGKTYAELGIVDAGEREKVFSSLISKGSIKDYELELGGKDGRRLNAVYNGELINIDGRQMVMSIVEDVTEKRRRAEREMKAQKLEALGVLAGGIAHDFNNILTGIVGNISLARALGGLKPEVAERLLECEKASKRAGELSHQLLTFARGGAPRKALIKLGPLITEAVTFALRGSNVVPVMDIADDLKAVEADRGQLSQVFSNLLINAAQAMPEGGEVRICAFNERIEEDNDYGLKAGWYISASVADKGCGIKSEIADRIFDPYFTTKPQGSGLGLSTVFSIMQRHSGGVYVKSSPGKGAELTVLLPSCGGEPLEFFRTETIKPPRPGMSLLVMDDESLLRELARSMAVHLGYEVAVAEDGAEAVVLAKNAAERGEPFSAAVLDLTVPGGIGGREAARMIAASSPSTKLIVSSGYSNDPVLADPARYGFSGMVAKPYTIEAMAAELSRVLGDS